MAEAALFSIATKLLSTIASTALEKAYERGRSIWEARDELAKLGTTLQAIQAVLLDAEKKQEGSHAIKVWIKRVRDVMYDAEDLFDEVITNDQLKQQTMKKNKHLGKVRVFGSHLNPIVANDSIATKVKAIRKSFKQISDDMALLELVECHSEGPIYGIRGRQDEGHFVDPKLVFGRYDDKEAVLEFLSEESNGEQNILVIAIVGIGGMGKTTLAQLVYDDQKVRNKFEKNRWWACISDIKDEREILGKIFHSITGKGYHELSLSSLQSEVKQFICADKKFLLVLDDLWDENRNRGLKLRALLGGGAKGSKVIVTTRHSTVAGAMDAACTRVLGGLNEEMSWCLFKKVAFRPGYEEDPSRVRIGLEIMKKCGNVPLAIRAVASALYAKDSITEWELMKDNEISQIEQGEDGIMSALKLSYNHLPSNLKNCFAYCSIFPKDHIIKKDYLIQLWIAQGYVHLESSDGSQTLEDVGHMYFMELLRRSFFQEVVEGSNGEIWTCKMHGLVHELADLVTGKKAARSTAQTGEFGGPIRHLGIGDNVSQLPTQDVKHLRSLLIFKWSLDLPILHQQITGIRSLRALDLSNLNMKEVPSSIGDLVYLRYLNLSENMFRDLPDSITKLLNLCTLDIRRCVGLEALPNDFRKLINLRHLRISSCSCLKHMPAGLRELTSLQRLDYFIVGGTTAVDKGNSLDELAQLKLRGELEISFSSRVGACDEDAVCSGVSKLPATLQGLDISFYPGMRIPSLPANLGELTISNCSKVKHLPALRCIPYLKKLVFLDMYELEYIEEEEENSTEAAGSSTGCLKTLFLMTVPKLKGWSRKSIAAREHSYTSPFTIPPRLCSVEELKIKQCHEIGAILGDALTLLKNLVICDCSKLKDMHLPSVDINALEELKIENCPKLESFPGEALRSLRVLHIDDCNNLNCVYLPSVNSKPNILKELKIGKCPNLESFPGGALTSLQVLHIDSCHDLKYMYLPSEDSCVLEELKIENCPKLESFPWGFISSLRILHIDFCRNLKHVNFQHVGSSVLEELVITGCPGLESFSGEDLISLRVLRISACSHLENLHIPSNVLADLRIEECPVLESFPGEALTSLRLVHIDDCCSLKSLNLPSADSNVLEEVVIRYCELLESFPGKALISLRVLRISSCSCLESLHLPSVASNILSDLRIEHCPQLESFQGEALTSLRCLNISICRELKKVPLPSKDSNVIEELSLRSCPDLELWAEDKRVADLGSFFRLKSLSFDSMPQLEKFQGEALLSLVRADICSCIALNDVMLPPQLKHLTLMGCPRLELWDEEKRGVDWESLPNLLRLEVDTRPERLPHCLQHREVITHQRPAGRRGRFVFSRVGS